MKTGEGRTPNEKFDFLGYTFRPRRSKESQRKVLYQFQPGSFRQGGESDSGRRFEAGICHLTQ